MVSRFLICENIEKKAEEDLLTILLSDNPNPQYFNYSPYILRSVNEKLLEEGKSIGLGYIADRKIIDSYWQSNPYQISTDLEMRIIYGTHIGCTDEIILFLKDNNVREKLLSDLNEIKQLRIRNNFLLRFRTRFKDNTIDDICEQIRVFTYEKNLKIKTKVFYLNAFEIEKEDYRVKLNLPEKPLYKCLRCNYCEYPTNFSANPIPNSLGRVKEPLITFRNRICFPCNLPTLSYDEIVEISTQMKYSKKDFSRPIFGQKNFSNKKLDACFALKQNNGICIFQDLEKKECRIYKHAPFNCKFYPFLVSKFDNKELIVDLDFSCPGVGQGSIVKSQDLIEKLHTNLKKTDAKTEFSIKELEEIWDNQIIWNEGERVKEADIAFSKEVFFPEG